MEEYFSAARLTALGICLSCAAYCYAGGPTNTQHRHSIEPVLKRYLSEHDAAPGASTRYISAFVDLNEDGNKEAIVYAISPTLCGTGGCPMLVLAPTDSTYRIVGVTTITQQPIRVLATKTKGWHDIGVWVEGGGIQPGYEARLRFNGRSYPSNPTVPPAQSLRTHVPGRTVISSTARGMHLR